MPLFENEIWGPDPNVNACVNLRRNNFDPPHFLSNGDNLQGSLFRLPCHAENQRSTTPPCGRSSPPGHPVVDGWRRDERTRGIPQSLPRSLVSSAKPTTGVQVVRPTAPMPQLAHSGCPQSRASPPMITSMLPSHRRPALRQLTFAPLLSR